MSNPIISNNPYFKTGQQRPNQAPQGFQQGYDYQQPNQAGYGYPDQQGYGNYPEQSHQGAFYPSGTAMGADDGRMTYQDALNKIGILLGLAVLSGVATAVLLPPAMWYPAAIGTTIAAFIVGIILAFQRMVKPGLAIAYSVLEGVALGAITAAFEQFVPGIAVQTIMATAIIVGVAYMLHYSGAVRTSSKGRKIVLTVMLGYIVFSLANLVLMLLGVFENQAWGMRGFAIAGIPLGVILGAVMIIVAAYMLIADFEDINIAIENGAPKEFSWTTGIAIVMTILWIYIEVLRIIAILDSRN